jgi:hypothetical protein
LFYYIESPDQPNADLSTGQQERKNVDTSSYVIENFNKKLKTITRKYKY